MTCFAPSASRTASSSCSSSSRPSATCRELGWCGLEQDLHPATRRVHWQEHRGKASTSSAQHCPCPAKQQRRTCTAASLAIRPALEQRKSSRCSGGQSHRTWEGVGYVCSGSERLETGAGSQHGSQLPGWTRRKGNGTRSTQPCTPTCSTELEAKKSSMGLLASLCASRLNAKRRPCGQVEGTQASNGEHPNQLVVMSCQ